MKKKANEVVDKLNAAFATGTHSEPGRFSCVPTVKKLPLLNSDIKTCRGNIANSDGRFMTAIEGKRAKGNGGIFVRVL